MNSPPCFGPCRCFYAPSFSRCCPPPVLLLLFVRAFVLAVPVFSLYFCDAHLPVPVLFLVVSLPFFICTARHVPHFFSLLLSLVFAALPTLGTCWLCVHFVVCFCFFWQRRVAGLPCLALLSKACLALNVMQLLVFCLCCWCRWSRGVRLRSPRPRPTLTTVLAVGQLTAPLCCSIRSAAPRALPKIAGKGVVCPLFCCPLPFVRMAVCCFCVATSYFLNLLFPTPWLVLLLRMFPCALCTVFTVQACVCLGGVLGLPFGLVVVSSVH